MKRETNISKELIIRYLEGQLLDHEYEQLSSLLKRKENQSLFDEVKRDWTPVMGQSDLVEMNWFRLGSRISRNKENKLSGRRVQLHWFYKVAAILILGFFIGIGVKTLTETADLFEGQMIVETPRGEKSKVTLSDGTEVWLNAKSKLTYLPFTSSLRQVSLEGEAYFNVKKNEKTRFVVVTPKCNIEVLGTKFNVMAYDEFNRNEVTLITGKVNISTPQNTITMSPGDRATITDNTIENEKVNPEQSIFWVDNKFNFNTIPLSELMKRLELWYDVDIECDLGSDKNVNFSGTFKNEETIMQVLDAINAYIPIEYERLSTRKIKIEVKSKNSTN